MWTNQNATGNAEVAPAPAAAARNTRSAAGRAEGWRFAQGRSTAPRLAPTRLASRWAFDYSPHVAANENRSVQLYQASLTTREQHEFARSERTIARGLKSFLAVGAALMAIRDRRLYRQQYDTFEEYCIRRWDFSRIRAYQICAASEVAASLSTIVNIPLPENEAQTRPLTRLKDPAQWRRAWQAAVKVAAAEKRPVTARDTEEAVRRLDGNGRIEAAWADGEPVYTCVQGTNADLIAAVARLYLKKGDRLADITFGRGVFWQKLNLSDYLFYKSDKITCPKLSP